MNVLASSADVNDFQRAVGMPYLSMKAFAQLLSLSMRAPLRLGPKTLMPSDSRASAMPLARGSSGPTTTRLTWLSLQNFASS